MVAMGIENGKVTYGGETGVFRNSGIASGASASAMDTKLRVRYCQISREAIAI
jgi:hypothetical protein